MKKIFLMISIITNSAIYAQQLTFNDLGILLSQTETIGTAKYNAMSGTNGAIGGDISTANPAGLATMNHNYFSTTLGTDTNRSISSYYNNNKSNVNYDLNWDQIGMALVFDTGDNNWQKIVLGLNYQLTNNFKNKWLYEGNSGLATFNKNPNNNTLSFNNANTQYFSTETLGETTKFSIIVASQYQKKFNIGASINFHDIDFVQKNKLQEINTDNSGNELDALLTQYDSHIATGASLNLGILYKINKLLRLGAAYESPTWYYDVLNESNLYDGRTGSPTGRLNNIGYIGNVDILPTSALSLNGYEKINTDLDAFEYKFKTPSKLTLSGALVLGKLGLLAADYTYKNYNDLEFLDHAEFENSNNKFRNNLINTHNLSVAGEINLNTLKLRAGGLYEQSPFKNNLNNADLNVIKLGPKIGLSAGAGLQINNMLFDLGYQYTKQTTDYNFYDQYTTVNAGSTDNRQSRFTLSYTYLF